MTYINQLETLCQQCGCKMETEVSLAAVSYTHLTLPTNSRV